MNILQFLKLVSIPMVLVSFLSLLYSFIGIFISIFLTKDNEESEVKFDYKIYIQTFIFSIFLGILLI